MPCFRIYSETFFNAQHKLNFFGKRKTPIWLLSQTGWKLQFILFFIQSIDEINRLIAAAGGVEECMRRIL